MILRDGRKIDVDGTDLEIIGLLEHDGKPPGSITPSLVG